MLTMCSGIQHTEHKKLKISMLSQMYTRGFGSNKLSNK